jgi:hypothetical protein
MILEMHATYRFTTTSQNPTPRNKDSEEAVKDSFQQSIANEDPMERVQANGPLRKVRSRRRFFHLFFELYMKKVWIPFDNSRCLFYLDIFL